MNAISSTIRASVVLLTLVGLVASTQAEERAFKLAGAGDAVLNASGFDFTADGVATHLGRWSNEGGVMFLGPDEDKPGNVLVLGWVTFTAADGEDLDGIITGSFNPTGNPSQAKFEWMGGTGRFVDASGVALFEVFQSPPVGGVIEFDFFSDGDIDY